MKKIMIFILIVILISGCGAESAATAPDIETMETVSSTQVTEQFPTEPPTLPPTEPDNSLCVPGGSYCDRFTVENSEEYMDYWIHIPDNAEKGMPLIVFLHGSMEIGRVDLLENYGIVSVKEELYGDDFPFLLLLPCTHMYSWTAGDVPETLKALIQSIVSEYEADPERIIITGHSLGSVGTWKMASLYSDFFAAAVPVSCGIDEVIDCERCAKVPIMAFAGTVGNDEKNYNRAMHVLVSRINEAGGNATMNVLEGADHDDAVTAPYTLELFEWMLAQ